MAASTESSQGERYGFVGIGSMGWHMAMNIAKKMSPGSTLTVCDIDTERVKQFLSDAATVTSGKILSAETPREVSETSDIILTSLPAAQHIKLVFSDPETGLLAASKSNHQRLFLETSTYEVLAALEIKKLVEASGLGIMIDTPVSGGPLVAEAGTLAVIVGGDVETYKTALPVLSFIGKPEKIHHCGPFGSGLVAKQANNYAACVSYLGLCEAMNMGVRYGLDPKILGSVINDSSGMSWNSINQSPVKGVTPHSAANRDWEGGAPTELCQGIINSVLETAQQVKAKMVVGPLLKEIFEEAVNDPRCKGKEYRSIYRLIADPDAE